MGMMKTLLMEFEEIGLSREEAETLMRRMCDRKKEALGQLAREYRRDQRARVEVNVWRRQVG